MVVIYRVSRVPKHDPLAVARLAVSRTAQSPSHHIANHRSVSKGQHAWSRVVLLVLDLPSRRDFYVKGREGLSSSGLTKSVCWGPLNSCGVWTPHFAQDKRMGCQVNLLTRIGLKTRPTPQIRMASDNNCFRNLKQIAPCMPILRHCRHPPEIWTLVLTTWHMAPSKAKHP